MLFLCVTVCVCFVWPIKQWQHLCLLTLAKWHNLKLLIKIFFSLSHTLSLLFHATVELILNSLSPVYIERLLPVLAERLDTSPHIEYYITWCSKLLSLHTETIKQNSTSLASLITDLQKSIIQKQKDLGKL